MIQLDEFRAENSVKNVFLYSSIKTESSYIHSFDEKSGITENFPGTFKRRAVFEDNSQ